MGLSLEVKKFINSEHSGEYIEIELPGELEVRRPRAKKAKPAPSAAESVGAKGASGSEDMPGAQDASNASEATGAENAIAPEDMPASDAAQPPLEGGPEMRHERARVHYIEAGSGEPLILVHTVGQSFYTWRRVFNRLSEHYRVIAPDLLGHGYSDRPLTFGYTIEEQADALRRFMDALGIESAHFAAFSMGCAYALKFALQYPERVGRLVLVSPGSITPEMPLSIRMIDSPLLGFFASRMYGLRTVENMLHEAVFDLTNITPDVVQEYYRPASDPEGRRAIRLSLQCFEDEEIIANLRALAADTLILMGAEDKWHTSETCELYHAAMRNAGFSVVRNAGHLMHEEKPDRFVAALLEFIPVVMP